MTAYKPQYLLPQGWLDSIYRDILGLGPETRTPEQIKVDKAAYQAETEKIVQKIKDEHTRTLLFATAAMLPILELHGPSISPGSRYPVCEGCDMSGWEAEAPGFPCRTYELAAKRRYIK